jgi:hypothetical protein
MINAMYLKELTNSLGNVARLFVGRFFVSGVLASAVGWDAYRLGIFIITDRYSFCWISVK